MTTHRPRYGVHIALIAICVILACPALYALQVATLTIDEAANPIPQLFPPSDDFYSNVWSLFVQHDFGEVILNTFTVAMTVVIGKTFFAMLAGLAFVYFDFPAKWVLFFVILLTLLMPTELIVVPLSNLVNDLHWIAEGHHQLALTMPFMASALGAFLFRQHFKNVPRELVEAAQLDGAGPLRFMFSILLPMSWNVIGAHAVIQFISMWHQYVWPFFLKLDEDKQMIQFAVKTVGGTGWDTDFGLAMAAGVISSIPPLIFFVLLQKQFMSGFAMTRDK